MEKEIDRQTDTLLQRQTDSEMRKKKQIKREIETVIETDKKIIDTHAKQGPRDRLIRPSVSLSQHIV